LEKLQNKWIEDYKTMRQVNEFRIGVYFSKLMINEYSETKKMVLMR